MRKNKPKLVLKCHQQNMRLQILYIYIYIYINKIYKDLALNNLQYAIKQNKTKQNLVSPVS